MLVQDIAQNSTLDQVAESEILGGCGWRRRRGGWRLKRVIYKRRGIKKIFIKWKCGVRYRKVKFIKYNFCGCC